MAAFGAVSSYLTRYRTWQGGDRARRDARPPAWGGFNGYPVLYSAKGGAGAMIRVVGDVAQMKLYDPKLNSWRWMNAGIVKRGTRHLNGNTLLSPTLHLSGRKLTLAQPVSIPKSWIMQQAKKQWCVLQKKNGFPNAVEVICAVDLGVNNQAVCSIIDQNGTVIARLFIQPQAVHMARQDRCVSKIQACARKTMGGIIIPGVIEAETKPEQSNQVAGVFAGTQLPVAASTTAGKLSSGFCKTLYRRVAHLNTEISRECSRKILAFARKHGASTIVLEDLKGFRPKAGAKRSNLKQRFHRWLHRKLARQLQSSAEETGMRVSIVNPRGTSAWAYDGSGKVARNKENHSLCIFANGKAYNADLNASYNIGARYFWRKLPQDVRDRACARLASPCLPRNGQACRPGKSPSQQQRTPVTLSSLWAAAA